MNLSKIVVIGVVFVFAVAALMISAQIWAVVTVASAFKAECKDGIAACAGRAVKEFNEAKEKK